MTAHELANKLLAGPNRPVIINGWGSDEGTAFEVSLIEIPEEKITFIGQAEREKDALGYPIPLEAIILTY